MTLPPFEDGESLYGRTTGSGPERVEPWLARHIRLEGLRKQFGEQILQEAVQLSSALVAKGVQSDIEIMKIDTSTRRTLLGRTKADHRFTRLHAGWKLVQVQKSWTAHALPRGEEFAQTPDTVVPAGTAYRGIALTTDRRLVPYEYEESGDQAYPLRVYLDEKGQTSMSLDITQYHETPSEGYAIVQVGQVDEHGNYDDAWPMHSYMRENQRLHPGYPWRPTAPGPRTKVYGIGIRSGLIGLAANNSIRLSQHGL